MNKYDSLLIGSNATERDSLCDAARSIEWIANQYDGLRLEIKDNQMIVTFGKTAKERRAAKRAKMRDEWIHKWYRAYINDESAYLKDEDVTGDGTKHVSVTCEGKNGYCETIGHAYTNPNDKYNITVGVAIAYARTQGVRCPWYV